MPELPEVETTRIGISPHVLGNDITDVIIRERRLRWPVPRQLKHQLVGQTINKIDRRAKYLLFHTKQGCMILHLGMSGSLRIVNKDTVPEKHDHVDIVFSSGICLRLRDPRRFGSIHWTSINPEHHKLIDHLGPEPFGDEFNAEYLYTKSRNRTQAIKTFIMDSRIVVGVGNIYANEALFIAGIHPGRKAGKISKARVENLVGSIKGVLNQALIKGGTTLRDFVNGDGKPGYFGNELQVYSRTGKDCSVCGSIIKVMRIGQRSTFYCSKCQR